MLFRASLLLVLAIPALARNDGTPAADESENEGPTQKGVPGKVKPEAGARRSVESERREPFDKYFGELPDRQLGPRFWRDFDGLGGSDRRHAAELFGAYLKGRGEFGRRITDSGLDPARLRPLLAKLMPYMFERDEGGVRSDRPFRGPSRRVWEKLVERYPDQPEGHAGLGAARLEQRDYAEAARAYDRAIELGDRSAASFVGRGIAADRIGDYEQANKDAQEALKLDPRDASATALLVLTRGRPSVAKLVLPSAARAAGPAGPAPTPAQEVAPVPASTPDVSVAAVSGGAAKDRADLVEASAKWTREASRALELGDVQAAFNSASRAIALDLTNPDARNARAIARDRRGDREGSVQDATAGLALAPDNVPLLNTRSWSLSGLKRYEAALQDASRAAELAAKNPYSRITMARAEGALGRREEMLESLREAARLDPRFTPTLQSALDLPRDQDTEFLFAGGTPGHLPRPRKKLPGFFFLVVSTLVGGGLMGAGLLGVLSKGWRGRLREAFSNPRPSGEPPPSGRFWDYYKFRRVIASGGRGIVYEADDQSLGRRVAVKKLRGEIRDIPKEREAFLKEARVVAGLRHPGIVEAFSVVEDGPDLYLILEYVEGKTLGALLHERGRLPAAEAVALLKDVCAAVQYAHDRGVIHRDLKPSNIMVTSAGRAKVMDFGIARRTVEGRQAALTATIAGTPSYMAPEAEEGLVRKESDVFALGVCCYEMLTGRLPYEGLAGALALRKQKGRFEPASRRAPGIPEALDAALARALSPSPEGRQDSPAQLYTELARSL